MEGVYKVVHNRFQPSSDLQAGCNADTPKVSLASPRVSTLIRPSGRMQLTSVTLTTKARSRFQPSSDLQAGCNQPGHAAKPLRQGFQPSSDLQAGCNVHSGYGRDHGGRVSTLIRPSGRMQPWPFAPRHCWPMSSFNPHPTFRPDATTARYPQCATSAGFNPHPTFRPDATTARYPQCATSAGFNPHPTFRPDATGPGCRRWLPSMCFNPHPTFRPDATIQRFLLDDIMHQFQPSSDLQAGCNSPIGDDVGPPTGVVSTLIRPSGRMQRWSWGGRGLSSPSFNPHPTFRPDATTISTCWPPGIWWFQPSSDLQAGCNQNFPECRPAFHVSTLIRPSGRMQPGGRGLLPSHQRVSTLIRPSGRMQPGGGPDRRAAGDRCFNPHPTFRPDATIYAPVT